MLREKLNWIIDRQKQRNKRMDPAHSIYLMIECCKALNYAHNVENPETNEPLGIVHRDISPPNILLSKNGEVKLVDFGLAKANSQIESTDPGVVKGKFSYLSPEAASGLQVDHRADIFAVGIILWELFTGKRLFYGDTDYQTVDLVRQARVPSIAAINPEIDAELEAIVRKALARDPDDRYASAADLGDALSQFLFSHRMKVTARDIANLVRDAQMEMMRKRSAEPKESIIDALINDEVAKLTSIVPDEDDSTSPTPAQAVGSQSLDPKEFVDTAGWVSDFGIDVPSSAIPRPTSDSGGHQVKPAPAAAPTPKRAPAPRKEPAPRQDAAPAPRKDPAPRPAASGDDDGLSAMLEPDKTGLHDTGGGRGLVIAILLLLVVGAGIGVGVFLFR